MSKEVIARIAKRGQTFEIIVDSTKIEEYREGKLAGDDLKEAIITDGIFKNIRSLKRVDEGLPMKNIEGMIEKHDDATLVSVFGTKDTLSIAKKILDEGEIQLTVEQRSRMTEQKRRQIINFIATRAIDPRTGKPHPPQRVEIAIDQMKVKIDPFVPAEHQIKELLPKLKTILPLSIEEKTINVRIPTEYAGKVRYIIERNGSIINETWAGAKWMGSVRLPAGMVPKLLDELLSATHGNVECDTG